MSGLGNDAISILKQVVLMNIDEMKPCYPVQATKQFIWNLMIESLPVLSYIYMLLIFSLISHGGIKCLYVMAGVDMWQV